MSLWSKYVTDPVADVGRDILGDEVADAVSSYGGFLEKKTDFIVGTLTGKTQQDIVEGAEDTLKDPGREAEKLAKDAAEIERLSTAESVRIMEEENERSVSTARARAGASGLSGASTEMFIAALEEAGQQDVEWLKTVGASNYENRLTEGRLAQAQATSNMWQTGVSTVGTGVGILNLFG